jgi:sulfur carrier protein ThiS
MHVSVTLHGLLAHEHQAYDGHLVLADGAVAADVPTALGIDPRACVVVVNGTAVTRSTPLSDGARAHLYPAQAGG